MAIIENQPKQIIPVFDTANLLTDWQNSLTRKVKARQLAKNTAKAYQRGAMKLIEWCESAYVEVIDYDAILDWQGTLLAEGKSPATVNAWLAGVKALFAWAVESRDLAYNPAKNVRGASRDAARHKRESLTDIEIRLVLAMPDPNTDIGKRDLAMLSLMAYTGARSVEVHRADTNDLRTEKGRLVLYVTGKGHIEADDIIVLVNPHLQDAMHRWMAVRKTIPLVEPEENKKPESPIFVSFSDRSYGKRLSLRAIRGIVKKYYGLAGVTGENKTTHSLRHTAITKAIENEAPIHKVQAMARHKSIETTMLYYHEMDRLEAPAEEYIDYGEPESP